jgi:hypothetical protein
MFGFLNKKSPLQKMEERYKKLLEEAYVLSRSDRKAADSKQAEAEALWQEIEQLKQQNSK